MSIRRTSLIFSGSVAIAVILASGSAILSEARRLLASVEASHAITTLSMLSKATVELSLERSLLQVGLAIPGPFPQEFRTLLNEQRTKSNDLFAQLDTYLAKHDLPREEAFRNGLVSLRATINEIRQAADPDLALPLEQRANKDAAVINRLKATVVSLKDLGELIRPDMHVLSNEINVNDLLMQRAWIIREYGGRERTYLAIASATGGALAAANLPEMYESHGRVMQAWSLIQTQFNRGGMGQSLDGPIRALQREYFNEYMPLRKAMYEASGKAYPVDFKTFFARSAQALDSATAVVVAASVTNIELAEEMKREAQLKLALYVGVSLLALLLTGLAVRYFLVRVARRIDGVTGAMRAVADGRLDVDIASFQGSDEVGAMAEALAVFRDNAVARRKLELQTRLDRDRELMRQDKLEQLVGRFRELSARVQEQLLQGMEAMRDAAGQLTSVGRGAADESERALATSRQMDTSMHSIGTVADQLSQSVQILTQKADGTRAMVVKATGIAQTTNDNVSALATAADRIGEVVNLIRAVAEQTNLLALNATIEAARAGEAGRGFAVVASEVKELANQTARATDEIAMQVKGIQGSTAETVAAIGSIASIITEIAALTESLSDAVRMQEESASSIRHSIGRATEDSSGVAQGLTHVGEAVSATNLQADRVETVSTEVIVLSGELTRAVSDFLSGVAQDVTDRRSETRFPASDPVRITLNGRQYNARLVDICEHGMKLSCEPGAAAALKKGMMVEVAWEDGGTTIADIIWTSQGTAGLRSRSSLARMLQRYAA